MKKYEYFDHTADIGLRVYGADLVALFENAGFALFDTLSDTSSVAPRQTRSFSLRRENPEELLVEWLGTLLYEFEVSGLLFSRFTVHDISGNSLTATASGEPYNPGKHELRAGIKAVTYHGLAIFRDRGIWQATVVLDI